MKEQIIKIIENYSPEVATDEILSLFPLSVLLPSKDEAVNVGFRKATFEGYNYRRVCIELDHDIYYSGWMDCYDWLSVNNH